MNLIPLRNMHVIDHSDHYHLVHGFYAKRWGNRLEFKDWTTGFWFVISLRDLPLRVKDRILAGLDYPDYVGPREST